MGGKNSGRKPLEGFIYVAYAREYPYLPIAVADSVKELSDITGESMNTIYAYTCNKTKQASNKVRFAKVAI